MKIIKFIKPLSFKFIFILFFTPLLRRKQTPHGCQHDVVEALKQSTALHLNPPEKRPAFYILIRRHHRL